MIAILTTAARRGELSDAEVEKAERDDVVLLCREDLHELWTAAQAGEGSTEVIRRLRYDLAMAKVRRAKGRVGGVQLADPLRQMVNGFQLLPKQEPSALRRRVRSRRSRIGAVGMKLPRSSPCSRSCASHSQSFTSVFRPGRCLTWRALTSSSSKHGSRCPS